LVSIRRRRQYPVAEQLVKISAYAGRSKNTGFDTTIIVRRRFAANIHQWRPLQRVAMQKTLTVQASNRRAAFAVSENGVLVYREESGGANELQPVH
jgi:hypothetical protein